MDTYRITFPTLRNAEVDVNVPDRVEPLHYLGHEIARELDLMRFEIEIGFQGGSIRRVGDTKDIPFRLALVGGDVDAAPCCPDPECHGNPCTFPGYANNH